MSLSDGCSAKFCSLPGSLAEPCFGRGLFIDLSFSLLSIDLSLLSSSILTIHKTRH